MPTVPDPTDAIDWGVALDDTDVTVYFAAFGERFDGRISWGNWSLYERNQVFEALDTYADVSDLTFRPVASPNEADFVLTRGYSLKFHGNFNPPDPAHHGEDGVGWFNTGPALWSGS